MGGGAG
jgi:hypothetical protein